MYRLKLEFWIRHCPKCWKNFCNQHFVESEDDLDPILLRYKATKYWRKGKVAEYQYIEFETEEDALVFILKYS